MTTAAAQQTPPTARTQPWLAISAGAILWSMVAFVVLHLVSPRNPALDTVSLYAFTDQAPGLLAISMLSLATGSVTALAALHAAGVPVRRTTKVLCGLWSGGLALAATFPVSYGELSSLVSGEIHQYACVAAFLSLPAIGFAVRHATRGMPGVAHNRAVLVRWTRYSTAGLILFGVSYLFAKFPGVPVLSDLSSILPVGLTQRVTLVIDIGLLGAILLLARAASAPAGSPATVLAG